VVGSDDQRVPATRATARSLEPATANESTYTLAFTARGGMTDVVSHHRTLPTDNN
jgi:hypothetical protein